MGAFKIFFDDSCIGLSKDDDKLLSVQVSQTGCVTSPWLSNFYMDGVVKKLNGRIIGTGLLYLMTNGVGVYMVNELVAHR